MTRLLLISDTHVPSRAGDLPARLWDAVEAADVVVHAGDWTSPDLLDLLEERAARVLGVWGNNDGTELRARLPQIAHFIIDGVRFAVTHETGPAAGRERRSATRFPDTDVLIFGHSHIPWDSTAGRVDGSTLRLLNPGSPTDRHRQPTYTWLTATAAAGALADVTLHHLAP